MPSIVERRCTFESCRHLLKDDWRFCPNCGTDNAPEDPAVEILACIHRMDLAGPFCFLCGYDSEAFLGVQHDKRKKMGIAAFVAAGVLFSLSAVMLAFFAAKPRVKIFYFGILFGAVLLILGAKLIIPRRSERTKR